MSAIINLVKCKKRIPRSLRLHVRLFASGILFTPRLFYASFKRAMRNQQQQEQQSVAKLKLVYSWFLTLIFLLLLIDLHCDLDLFTSCKNRLKPLSCCHFLLRNCLALFVSIAIFEVISHQPLFSFCNEKYVTMLFIAYYCVKV